MSKQVIFLDSFSGSVVDLPKKDRTQENVLEVLKNDPMVSTWDMSENPWLRTIIANLVLAGEIKPIKSDYPWHRYKVIKGSEYDYR